jgi:GTP-binding protein HflX
MKEQQLSDVERSLALERARHQLESRVQGGLRAYLASLELVDDDPSQVQESLQELGSLVRSLGDEPMGATVQKRARVDAGTFIGQGKAEELRARAVELDCAYVVFDQELSPSQVRNLEKLIDKPVLDRTAVILQIFRKNAKTREAKTQVEIAHLEFLAPRLSNAWIAYERQRGGSGGGGGGGSGGGTRVRGAGETQLELDRRRMRDRIAGLRRDLEKIRRERETQRKARSDELKVALVGYTNAGKTTIMNALTESQLSAKDALFETLDSTVRLLRGTSKPRVLLTDTVGFIRNLPHGLVASFQSTLDETARADLLVHVVDLSHAHWKDHMRVTDEVLKEVGAGEVPRLLVFNKVDALKGEPRLARILERSHPGSVCVSASSEADMRRLREAILNYFLRDMVEFSIDVPYSDNRLMALVHGHARVLETAWKDDVASFRLRMSKETYARYFEDVVRARSDDPQAHDDAWNAEGFTYE